MIEAIRPQSTANAPSEEVTKDRRTADVARHGLLRVRTAVAGTVVKLAVIGELDLSGVALLEDRVRHALALHRTAQVIIDLRRLTFIDSSGLRLLLVLAAEARSERWRLTIVRGPAAVQRTMELAGVGEHFETVDDPAEAIGDGPPPPGSPTLKPVLAAPPMT